MIRSSGYRGMMGAALLAAAAVCARAADDAPLKPVRVCEALENLTAHDGKVLAILGRFSFRENGRFLGEESCERPAATGDFVWPTSLRVQYDSKTAPPSPPKLEYDAPTLYQVWRLVKQRTALGKFRFGTVDYDRWAVVYGRLEVSQGFKMGAQPGAGRKNALEPPPAQVVCSGESVVLFLAEPER